MTEIGAMASGAALAGIAAWAGWRWLAGRRARGDMKPELPCAFGHGSTWIAVRSADTAEIAELLGLGELQAAGWSLGVSTAYRGDAGERQGRVFVTPPVDGWTYVVGGALPLPDEDTSEARCMSLLQGLSRTFGHVQYYCSQPGSDTFAWCRLSHGRVIRAFGVRAAAVVWNRGAVTPPEHQLGLDLFRLRDVTEASGPWLAGLAEPHVLRMASSWSQDPTRFGLRNDLEPGLGLLAVVPEDWGPRPSMRDAA